jgi:hypothetical protein
VKRIPSGKRWRKRGGKLKRLLTKDRGMTPGAMIRSLHTNTQIPSLQDRILSAWYASPAALAPEGQMPVTIGRRQLIAALGGAATWPLPVRAQQTGKNLARLVGQPMRLGQT